MAELTIELRKGRRFYLIDVEGEGRVELGPGRFTYESIVSAIINQKYSSDEMQAIINNYLLDNDAYKAEFDEMQNYRKKAKEIAKNLIEHQTN
jgi:hypothetical protein